jgi:hypothetical protein
MNETLHQALQELILEDPPRPGQAGGIGQVRVFRDETRAFNVVSVGTGPGHRGLLKSVRADGRMEGTVYVVPFRQHVRVRPLSLADGTIRIPGPLVPGSQVEIRGASSGTSRLTVRRGGVPLDGLDVRFDPGEWLFVLRFPERGDALEIGIAVDAGAELESVQASLQSPEVADIHRGRHEGVPHRGGVTFDLLGGGGDKQKQVATAAGARAAEDLKGR